MIYRGAAKAAPLLFTTGGNMKVKFLWLFAVASIVTGCNKSEPSPEKVNDADRILLEQLKQKEMEKQQLLNDPDTQIESGQWEKFDKGIINDYTQVVGCNFTNNSKFAVTGISGSVTIMTDNETVIGTIPFSSDGVLLAGETKKLKLTSGEISGKGTKATFDIQSVKIIGD